MALSILKIANHYKGNKKDLQKNIQGCLDYEIDEKKVKNCDHYETIEKRHARIEERRYYICSIASDAKRFGHALRNHWDVENNVHWVMDVIFNEDRALQASANAPEKMASLRRLALNLLSLHKSQKLKKRKRVLMAIDNNFLQEIMFSTD
jgi:predicted transposase YbfD/YdcC